MKMYLPDSKQLNNIKYIKFHARISLSSFMQEFLSKSPKMLEYCELISFNLLFP